MRMEEESTRRMDQFEEEVQGERTSERRRDWTSVRRDWDCDIFCEGGGGGEERRRREVVLEDLFNVKRCCF